MDSFGNFLALLGVLTGIASLFAILLPKMRTFFVWIALALLIVLLVGLVALRRNAAERGTEKTDDPFSRGVQLYETGRFNAAVDAFESYLASGQAEKGRIDEARYYLASAALHLVSPDCEVAIAQLRLISPDPKHLGSLILEECRNVGCMDCQNLLSIR